MHKEKSGHKYYAARVICDIQDSRDLMLQWYKGNIYAEGETPRHTMFRLTVPECQSAHELNGLLLSQVCIL